MVYEKVKLFRKQMEILIPEGFKDMPDYVALTKWMDGKLSLQSFFQADLGYTHNKVDNNNTFSALANWNYGCLLYTSRCV